VWALSAARMTVACLTPLEKQGQAMEPLTRKDVVSALGAVDDFIVTDIVATGATVQELAEAQAWLCSDEAMMNEGRPLAAGRVGQLVEILQNIEEEQPGPAGHEV
jgi:hypothetical protein